MASKSEVLPLVSPKPEAHHHLLGLSLVACSAFTFSLMSCAIKYESYVMSSMETVFWRSGFAWILILIAIKCQRVSLYVAPEYRFFLAIRCFVGFLSMSLGFWTMSQMVLADASVIIFTSPVWSFFLGALILHETIDPISFSCALCSFLGVVCVSRPSFLFGESADDGVHGSKFAVVGGLCAAASQALVYVVVRGLKGLHFMVVIQYFMLTCTMGSGLWMLLVEQRINVALTADVWAAAVATGVFGFMGQLFMTKGFQLENVGIASVMRYLDIVFVLGAVIICSCAIVIALRKAHKQ
ncbi:hypothetical protein SPRG_01228 [Saprolegnia parasitica CBS 223.65]|uniref:EamA domain-containing protein n=1 Tax=Saprolegnia parasitica (strain CBS 223.65) TaxID=695850 RepID=A0A067CXF3_SAPPC|nr:hypothetical protein SPRG_01228 [Saprolegnia parasitica CBS 223.65]KDO33950.1 hypothetical protein SPRG_01228 [Saprolegnia parasitica CBS 223.65]|eukprot:XP_012194843.1 hypothetical protein SPRG_01228 [Saprolegnia parasitica CBS 223.65]